MWFHLIYLRFYVAIDSSDCGCIGLAIVTEGRKQGNLAKKAEKLPPHAQEFSGSMTGQSTQIMVRNLLSQYSELSVKQIA